MAKTKIKTFPEVLYESSDLFLSAFLKARGLKLRGARKLGGKTIFVFRDEESRDRLVSDYFNDGPVGASSYRTALADLKSLIFRGE